MWQAIIVNDHKGPILFGLCGSIAPQIALGMHVSKAS
jgi:hypothetical protein